MGSASETFHKLGISGKATVTAALSWWNKAIMVGFFPFNNKCYCGGTVAKMWQIKIAIINPTIFHISYSEIWTTKDTPSRTDHLDITVRWLRRSPQEVMSRTTWRQINIGYWIHVRYSLNFLIQFFTCPVVLAYLLVYKTSEMRGKPDQKWATLTSSSPSVRGQFFFRRHNHLHRPDFVVKVSFCK